MLFNPFFMEINTIMKQLKPQSIKRLSDDYTSRSVFIFILQWQNSNSMHLHLPSGRRQESWVHSGWGRGSTSRWLHCYKASSVDQWMVLPQKKRCFTLSLDKASPKKIDFNCPDLWDSYRWEVCAIIPLKWLKLHAWCPKIAWQYFKAVFVLTMTSCPLSPSSWFSNCIIKKQTKSNKSLLSLRWSSSENMLHTVHFIALCESHDHEADVSIPIIAQRLAVIMSESHSP